jgi:hypothetical protein
VRNNGKEMMATIRLVDKLTEVEKNLLAVAAAFVPIAYSVAHL